MSDSEVFKILLIGDSAVGKTSLLLRYSDPNNFQETSVNMTSVDYKNKNITIDGKTFNLQIWDTAGQERFRTITSSFYRGAHGVLVCYDVTDQLTYNNVGLWMQEIQRYGVFGVSRVLVGNKCDLKDRKLVNTSIAQEYADTLGIPFIETSATTGVNVEEAFMAMADEIYRNHMGGSKPSIVKPVCGGPPSTKKSFC
ncbi:hypothetical protein ACTFIY_009920 [Dictyostelium cf. discoideum]